MAIDDKVREALNEGKTREKDPNFQSLRDFYETMKREGLVIKQEYTLPPVDTIGRSLYQTPEKPTNKEENEKGL